MRKILINNRRIKSVVFILGCLIQAAVAKSQLMVLKNTADQNKKVFVHPGILQNRADLEMMKRKIQTGEQPWKEAFSRLQKFASLEFIPQPFTHVIRGSYGRPAIGGSELSASADQAYGHALMFYVTGEKKHAQKAIEILNAWSYKLWDFEENDAKLLAAWTGHVFANAAEIIRYSNAGWQEKDITKFKRMLLTVYYPLIKDFFPEANGNWDAAFINTMLSIGIFCDDRKIFNRAVEHYLRGEGNGGITKYIYPNGQCQESTRDQAHVQLGLGEFAEACQVAWTQGVNLYGAANNRLALGIEYTAKYMLGEEVPAYGKISVQARDRLRSIYESVYQHYHSVEGLKMPYTARAVNSTRSQATIDVLTAVRSSGAASNKNLITTSGYFGLKKPLTGAMEHVTSTTPADFVKVAAGSSVQAAIDDHKGTGAWIILEKGVHTLPAPLRMRSGMTLAGQGRETILFLSPKVPAEMGRAAIINSTDTLHDVVLKDFIVEGADSVETTRDPNQDRRKRASQMAQGRAGISFAARHASQMRNIRIEHVTVRNCTHNGVAIKGAYNVIINECDFSDNGGSVAPGRGLLHNLLLTRVTKGQVTKSRFDTSPWGNGMDVTLSSDIIINGNEVARNAGNGIKVADCEKIEVRQNLAEGNDANGISLEVMFDVNRNITISDNLSHYNGKSGIKVIGGSGNRIQNNKLLENGRSRTGMSSNNTNTTKQLKKT